MSADLGTRKYLYRLRFLRTTAVWVTKTAAGSRAEELDGVVPDDNGAPVIPVGKYQYKRERDDEERQERKRPIDRYQNGWAMEEVGSATKTVMAGFAASAYGSPVPTLKAKTYDPDTAR